MAKDPAFLFYPGDWLGGTMHLDFECKGAYISLLMLQFNKGHMTLHMIKQVLGHRFEHIWPQVADKFLAKDGFFWNERLKIEKENRVNFCKSRKDNRNSTKHMYSHTSPRMENEDENIIEDINRGGNEKTLLLIPEMLEVFKKYNPKYPSQKDKDYKPLLSIAAFFCEQGKLTGSADLHREKIIEVWERISQVISKDNFYYQKPLSTISNQIQAITQIALNGKSTNKKGKPDYGSQERGEQLNRMFNASYGNGGSATG